MSVSVLSQVRVSQRGLCSSPEKGEVQAAAQQAPNLCQMLLLLCIIALFFLCLFLPRGASLSVEQTLKKEMI